MSNERYVHIEGSDRRFDRNLILTVVVSALALALLQVSSVNTLLPSIQAGLGAEDSDLQWVLSGYALAYGIILIPIGRFGDIFGRSGGFVTGVILFSLASLGCGLVQSAVLLNAMRIAQGFGAGVFSPQVTALIQEYFDGQDRARAFGIMGLVIAASVAVGPVMSGGFVALLGSESGWRWSFLINLPLGLILTALAFRWLPFAKERRTIGKGARAAKATSPTPREPIDIDPLGMVLVTATVLCIMVPFMTAFSWRWYLLIAGVVLAAAWIAWESWYKEHGHYPMVDLALFRIPSYTYCTAITALQFLGTTSIFVVVSMFAQQGLGLTALQAGLIGLPNAIISAYFAVWSGKRSFAHGAQIQVAALVLMLVGMVISIACAFAIAYGTPVWVLALSLTLVGVGQGMMGSANQTQAMLHITPAHAGIAGGVQQTSQRITTAIGNAMITAVLFAGRGAGATASQWARGVSLAWGVICLALVVALIVAIVFMRKYPHAGPALSAESEA